MIRRVLVTRPEPGAAQTAERLRAAGYEPIVLPLTRIEPIEIIKTPEPDAYAAVAITSANAVRHAPPSLLATLSGKRCYAVGHATAQVAAEAGLDVIDIEAGDASSLARAVIETEMPDAGILYLCGRARTGAFTAELASTSMTIGICETYDTRRIAYTHDEIADTLQRNAIDAALVYSAAGGAALAALTGCGGLLSYFADTMAVCISGRAAAGLRENAGMRCVIAEQASEQGMVSALASLG